MIRLWWARVTGAVPFFLLVTLGRGLEAQTPDARVARAAADIEALQVERALDTLRAVLETDQPVADSTLARAHLLAGIVHQALGDTDSTRAHFAAAIERDVLTTLDPDTHNPELIGLFQEARSSTPAITAHIEPPLTIHPLAEPLGVRIAVGMPGSVEIGLHAGADASGPIVSRSAGRLDGDSVLSLSLAPTGDSAIAPGRYTLLAGYTTRSGEARSTTLVLDVRRQSVDTLAFLPRPDSTAFRPEFRRGGPAVSSLITGVVVGAAATALPVLLWNGDLGSAEVHTGAIAVGGSIAIAGIVGMVVGRPQVPVSTNIEFNEGVLSSWREENERIASQNVQRRMAAPLSIWVIQE